MATPLERIQAAWRTGDPWALHREVEALAADGCCGDQIEQAIEVLLLEVRAAGADEDTEEIINSVGDRLHGWCHESYHIKTRPADPPLPVNGQSPTPCPRHVS